MLWSLAVDLGGSVAVALLVEYVWEATQELKVASSNTTNASQSLVSSSSTLGSNVVNVPKPFVAKRSASPLQTLLRLQPSDAAARETAGPTHGTREPFTSRGESSGYSLRSESRLSAPSSTALQSSDLHEAMAVPVDQSVLRSQGNDVIPPPPQHEADECGFTSFPLLSLSDSLPLMHHDHVGIDDDDAERSRDAASDATTSELREMARKRPPYATSLRDMLFLPPPAARPAEAAVSSARPAFPPMGRDAFTTPLSRLSGDDGRGSTTSSGPRDELKSHRRVVRHVFMPSGSMLSSSSSVDADVNRTSGAASLLRRTSDGERSPVSLLPTDPTPTSRHSFHRGESDAGGGSEDNDNASPWMPRGGWNSQRATPGGGLGGGGSGSRGGRGGAGSVNKTSHDPTPGLEGPWRMSTADGFGGGVNVSMNTSQSNTTSSPAPFDGTVTTMTISSGGAPSNVSSSNALLHSQRGAAGGGTMPVRAAVSPLSNNSSVFATSMRRPSGDSSNGGGGRHQPHNHQTYQVAVEGGSSQSQRDADLKLEEGRFPLPHLAVGRSPAVASESALDSTPPSSQQHSTSVLASQVAPPPPPVQPHLVVLDLDNTLIINSMSQLNVPLMTEGQKKEQFVEAAFLRAFCAAAHALGHLLAIASFADTRYSAPPPQQHQQHDAYSTAMLLHRSASFAHMDGVMMTNNYSIGGGHSAQNTPLPLTTSFQYYSNESISSPLAHTFSTTALAPPTPVPPMVTSPAPPPAATPTVATSTCSQVIAMLDTVLPFPRPYLWNPLHIVCHPPLRALANNKNPHVERIVLNYESMEKCFAETCGNTFPRSAAMAPAPQQQTAASHATAAAAPPTSPRGCQQQQQLPLPDVASPYHPAAHHAAVLQLAGSPMSDDAATNPFAAEFSYRRQSTISYADGDDPHMSALHSPQAQRQPSHRSALLTRSDNSSFSDATRGESTALQQQQQQQQRSPQRHQLRSTPQHSLTVTVSDLAVVGSALTPKQYSPPQSTPTYATLQLQQQQHHVKLQASPGTATTQVSSSEATSRNPSRADEPFPSSTTTAARLHHHAPHLLFGNSSERLQPNGPQSPPAAAAFRNVGGDDHHSHGSMWQQALASHKQHQHSPGDASLVQLLGTSGCASRAISPSTEEGGGDGVGPNGGAYHDRVGSSMPTRASKALQSAETLDRMLNDDSDDDDAAGECLVDDDGDDEGRSHLFPPYGHHASPAMVVPHTADVSADDVAASRVLHYSTDDALGSRPASAKTPEAASAVRSTAIGAEHHFQRPTIELPTTHSSSMLDDTQRRQSGEWLTPDTTTMPKGDRHPQHPQHQTHLGDNSNGASVTTSAARDRHTALNSSTVHTSFSSPIIDPSTAAFLRSAGNGQPGAFASAQRLNVCETFEGQIARLSHRRNDSEAPLEHDGEDDAAPQRLPHAGASLSPIPVEGNLSAGHTPCGSREAPTPLSVTALALPGRGASSSVGSVTTSPERTQAGRLLHHQYQLPPGMGLGSTARVGPPLTMLAATPLDREVVALRQQHHENDDDDDDDVDAPHEPLAALSRVRAMPVVLIDDCDKNCKTTTRAFCFTCPHGFSSEWYSERIDLQERLQIPMWQLRAAMLADESWNH